MRRYTESLAVRVCHFILAHFTSGEYALVMGQPADYFEDECDCS